MLRDVLEPPLLTGMMWSYSRFTREPQSTQRPSSLLPDLSLDTCRNRHPPTPGDAPWRVCSADLPLIYCVTNEGCARLSGGDRVSGAVTASPRSPSRYRGAPRAAGSQRRTHQGVTVGAGNHAVQDTFGSTSDSQRIDPIVS